MVGLAVSNAAIAKAKKTTDDAYLREVSLRKQATDNLELARSRQAESEAHRRRAQDNFLKALDALDRASLLFRERPKLGRSPAGQEIAVARFDQFLAFYRDLLRRPAASPSERLEKVWVLLRVGQIHTIFGRSSEAEAAYREANILASKLANEVSDEPHYRQEAARVSVTLADSLSLRVATSAHASGEERAILKARFGAASQLYNQAIGLLERLVSEHPDKLDFRYELARAYVARGRSASILGSFAAGESRHRRPGGRYRGIVPQGNRGV